MCGRYHPLGARRMRTANYTIADACLPCMTCMQCCHTHCFAETACKRTPQLHAKPALPKLLEKAEMYIVCMMWDVTCLQQSSTMLFVEVTAEPVEVLKNLLLMAPGDVRCTLLGLYCLRLWQHQCGSSICCSASSNNNNHNK